MDEFRVGDRVRDLGLYRDGLECDGIVVSTTREIHEIGYDWNVPGPNRPRCWVKIRAALSLTVKFKDGKVRYYNPYGSTMIECKQSILWKF